MGAFWCLRGLVDEDDAAVCQRFYDVTVVHDLFAYINGRAVLFQRLFYGLDRAVHACAVSARGREENIFTISHGSQSIETLRKTIAGPNVTFLATPSGTINCAGP